MHGVTTKINGDLTFTIHISPHVNAHRKARLNIHFIIYEMNV